ncbi:hypothetical protein [Vibrio parahaemolyticus]|uniref:hypothetical protein n=1 Tax=Vibrio parahaemolyticus TaxID=670 RepID=UPI00111E3B1E|nr:hypothetical protein [Vibrio parahaemolyticus]
MNSDQVRDTLFAIFETGVFYNASIIAYKEQVRVFSYLEDILLTGSVQNRIALLESVNNHFMEHCSDLRKDIIKPNENHNQHHKINAISRYINSYLNLPWPLFLLLRKNRENHNPKVLLRKYFEVYTLTNGFQCFDSKRLREIISEHNFLKEIRDKKLLILGRTSFRLDEKHNFLYIYYDDNKTSFRQSLKNSISLFDDGDCLRYFRKPKGFSDIKSIGRLLIALDYSARDSEFELKKQRYFNELISQYPAETKKGFSDERTLYRAINCLDEYLTAVKEFYQIDIEDTDSEEKYCQSTSKIDMSSRVDASTFVKTALSTYINYFSYIIANKEFFQGLEKLKYMICKELKENHELSQMEIELRVSLILNHINVDLKTQEHQSDFYDSDVFRDKYKKEIIQLREHPIPLDLWGYYFLDGFIPTISELITVVNEINKICSNNLDGITHNDLDSLSVKFEFNKVRPIQYVLPIESKGANAGFGFGNPAVIMPRSNSNDVSKNIQSALNLFDRSALRIHLHGNVIADKLKAYESLLLGLYYFYEKEWKGKNISEEKCVETISSFYDIPIAKSKLRSGKAEALKLINTFVPDQAI